MVERAVGKYRRLAVERHERDLEDAEDRGLHFDAEAADRVVAFFETYLRHHKGEWAGELFELEEWQREEIIRPLFGWMRGDGTRRFRTAYIEVPRKNGKSTLAAGIGLYLTVADGEPGAEVYSSATKKDQAKIVHEAATQMVKRSPQLKRFAKTLRNNIHVPALGSKFEPLGADSDTLDGLNTHGNIIDELHAHRDRRLWDVLITSMGARRQPMTAAITTAGVYDRESIGWEQHEYATKVLEGIIPDDSFFGYIAAADEGDDWTSPATWYKANPNLGVSLKEEYLATECERAQHSPAYQNTFRRLHLDEWTQQADRWIDMKVWNGRAGIIDPDGLSGQRCVAGLDLASTTDIAAFLLLFPPAETEELWRVLARFWIPEERIAERAQRDRVPYDAWVRDGWITATEGNVIDYDKVRADINEDGARYQIEEIAIDRWNATQIATQLDGDGFTVAMFGQGFASMSAPTKELLTLLLGGRLAHGGNPVLDWMASNVAVKQDEAGNLKPDRKRSSEKIDGIVALIMALGRAMVQAGPVGSVYEERGVVVL